MPERLYPHLFWIWLCTVIEIRKTNLQDSQTCKQARFTRPNTTLQDRNEKSKENRMIRNESKRKTTDQN